MLTSLKIKKYLRSANKTIRSVNDGILHDDLWRGRFYARQKKYWKQEYEDKSGLQVIFLYEFVDLKTGYTKEAGYCLVTTAQRDGQRIIGVLMKETAPKTSSEFDCNLSCKNMTTSRIDGAVPLPSGISL